MISLPEWVFTAWFWFGAMFIAYANAMIVLHVFILGHDDPGWDAVVALALGGLIMMSNFWLMDRFYHPKPYLTTNEE